MNWILGGLALALIVEADEIMWVWALHSAEITIHQETYESGGIKEEYQYYIHPESGERVKHGWYRSYYPDGSPQSEGTYKGRGKYTAGARKYGRWVYFSPRGVLIDEDVWQKGKCVEQCEGDEIE